jgi:4-amino-4-deoxy-L-arabinose transferase-like glycosyltransferase
VTADRRADPALRREAWPAPPVAATLALALSVRVGVLLGYLATHGGRGEAWEYERIAQSLLAGEGYTYLERGQVRRAFGWPLLSLVSYALHLVGGAQNFVPYFVFQLILSVAIVWLTYVLARSWLGEATGRLAALLVALEPGLVIYGAYKIHEMTLATFLLMAGVVLFQRLRRRGFLGDAAALGVIGGLGLLARGTVVALFAPLAVWAVGSVRVNRRALGLAGLAVGVALLTVAPWTVRNYLVLGQFVFISTGGSKTFWQGNSPASIGTNWTLEGERVLAFLPPELQERLARADELERQRLYREAAIDQVRREPGRFLRRTAEKFGYFFWFAPTYGRRYGLATSVALGHKTYQAFALSAAVLGVAAAVRAPGEARRTALLLLLLVAVVAGLHALVYVEGRHRILVMPIILSFAAHGIWSAVGRLRARRLVARPAMT